MRHSGPDPRRAISAEPEENAALDAQLATTNAAIQRYMLALENGTVAEQMFGERANELGAKAQTLRFRRSELATTLDLAATTEAPPTDEAIAAIHNELCSVSEHAPDPIRRAVTQAFVHELENARSF